MIWIWSVFAIILCCLNLYISRRSKMSNHHRRWASNLGNQEIRKSGKRESRKSGIGNSGDWANSQIRKSRSQLTWNSREARSSVNHLVDFRANALLAAIAWLLLPVLLATCLCGQLCLQRPLLCPAWPVLASLLGPLCLRCLCCLRLAIVACFACLAGSVLCFAMLGLYCWYCLRLACVASFACLPCDVLCFVLLGSSSRVCLACCACVTFIACLFGP